MFGRLIILIIAGIMTGLFHSAVLGRAGAIGAGIFGMGMSAAGIAIYDALTVMFFFIL